MAKMAVELYLGMMESALPVAIAFELCNLLVCTFLRVAFGGKLWFGR